MKAQLRRQEMFRPVISVQTACMSHITAIMCILCYLSRLVVRSTFPFAKSPTSPLGYPDLTNKHQQVNHVVVGGKFISDIINVRTYRSTNIRSDCYLDALFVHSKLPTVYNTHRGRTPRPSIELLRESGVVQEYAQQLEAAVLTAEQLGGIHVGPHDHNLTSFAEMTRILITCPHTINTSI